MVAEAQLLKHIAAMHKAFAERLFEGLVDRDRLTALLGAPWKNRPVQPIQGGDGASASRALTLKRAICL